MKVSHPRFLPAPTSAEVEAGVEDPPVVRVQLARLFAQAKLLTLRRKPLAIDSTCYEQRHRSLHYDRRCRRIEPRRRDGRGQLHTNEARQQR